VAARHGCSPPQSPPRTSLREPIHTLLVAGCPNAAEISPALAVTNWLRQVVPTTRRYGSVCSGAFFLAAGVTHLAARSGLSPRHFARLFRTEVGATPAVWVGAARVSAARRMLESGREAPKQVAVQCGFANADVLRRAFVRHVGVTPAEYRKSYDRRSPFA
jgi:transcriptional regulator GlxA family with amidase domain